MHKLFTRKYLHLYTENEKSKISTNLKTVSIILLYSATIVWHILSIGATVNCYLLLLPLETRKCYMCHNLSSLIYSKKFKFLFFLFILYMVGKLSFFPTLIKKHTCWTYLASKTY